MNNTENFLVDFRAFRGQKNQHVIRVIREQLSADYRLKAGRFI